MGSDTTPEDNETTLKRGPYKCKKCGQLTRQHVCPNDVYESIAGRINEALKNRTLAREDINGRIRQEIQNSKLQFDPNDGGKLIIS